jgi:hypothetical protein
MWHISETPPLGKSRCFLLHDQACHSRLHVTLNPVPAEPLRNGQCADILLVLAACLAGTPPPGIMLTNHVVRDSHARCADVAFAESDGFANVIILCEDDVSLDGDAPSWQASPCQTHEIYPQLALLAAHLTAHRLLSHLHDDPGHHEQLAAG